MDNVEIIGTSHIASESLVEIKNAFFKHKPDIVCVELDKGRLYLLEHPEKQSNKISLKTIRIIGIKGFLFAMMGKFLQNKLGNIVKLKPGSDMLLAATLAKNNHLKLALIDRDINVTLKRFSQKFSYKEKLQIVKDLISGIINKKNKMKISLNTVPKDEMIDFLVSKVKVSYPNIYKVIIEERNHIMARKIVRIAKKYPEEKVLVVVGAGHKKEIVRLLDVYEKKIEVIN